MSTELIGKQLGEFDVRRELGRGGMGVVYEAVQTSLNRRVALKVLGHSLALTPQAVGRFRREAEAAAKLHHTNIVPVFAIGVEGDTHFYAMELINGPSLDAVIRQLRTGPAADTAAGLSAELVATAAHVPAASLDPGPGSASGSSAGRFDRAAALIADVADALNHAHQYGVIHRDIKPSNLMLASDGRLSLTDFGLARVLDQPGVTVTGEFVGTPAYMSPEQITADRVPVDRRTDIYSLGATLYELLTLRPPFTAKGRDQLLALVIQKDPPSPRSINPKVPRDLETICLKCLEKDPDRRYQSAKELADDLRRYVNRFAILARRPGLGTRAKKWVKRNPALATAFLAVLFAVTTAGAFAWQAHDTEQQRLADQLKRDTEAADEKRRAVIERGMVAALAADLPGAEKAVAEAEALGVSAGETRMLRGFIAFHNGQAAEAVGHLELAVQFMPGRVAPLALLAVAYYFDGNPAVVQIIAKVEAMSPETPEDKLFKGTAIALERPTEGLRLIKEALNERRSTLGHLLLADARLQLAQSSGTVPDAESAVAACELAKQLLPDNPERLGKSCLTLLTAMAAHEHSGNRAKAAEYLDAARQEAANLAHFDRNPTAIVYRYDVAAAIDGLDGKLDLTAELRAARRGGRVFLPTLYEADNWFCLGNDRQAEAVAGEIPAGTGNVRALAALGRPDGGAAALAAIDGFAGPDTSWQRRLTALPIQYALDRTRFAAVVNQLRREGSSTSDTIYIEQRKLLLAYLEGTLREKELFAAPAHDKYARSSRHYFVAWKRLGEGDREGARKAFEDAYRIKLFDSFYWVYSRAILIRMKDPNWPQAILEKKQ